jgi:hypothetical protein
LTSDQLLVIFKTGVVVTAIFPVFHFLEKDLFAVRSDPHIAEEDFGVLFDATEDPIRATLGIAGAIGAGGGRLVLEFLDGQTFHHLALECEAFA